MYIPDSKIITHELSRELSHIFASRETVLELFPSESAAAQLNNQFDGQFGTRTNANSVMYFQSCAINIVVGLGCVSFLCVRFKLVNKIKNMI